jgi:TolB protein
VLGAALAAGAGLAQGPPPTGATIIITDPRQERLAIPDCVPRTGDEASRDACRALTAVLRRDLRFEGLFSFVSEPLLASIPPQDPDRPRMEDWQAVNASAVVSTRAQVAGGRVTVTVRVLRVPSGEEMLSRRYEDRADQARYIAHSISDEVVALAQQKGVARTRIAFTSDRDAARGRPVKEIYLVDYDGHNPRRATVNNNLAILPAWAPDGRSIAFTLYSQRNPDIFRAFIFEARRATLTGGGGQAFAPSFSPDGRHIAYASNRSGNMEVWVANADGTSPHKLTSSPALDTAPTWSPNGREIAFTSDRTGSPQIYLMDADTGLNVRRLTTVGNWNDAPAWNPAREYADEVAYTARLEAGGFDIAVVNVATRQVRQVTQGRGSCEYPSWAPSGRHLVFSCQRARGGTWQITVSNRDGSLIETLPAGPGNNVQPDWSPSPQ